MSAKQKTISLILILIAILLFLFLAIKNIKIFPFSPATVSLPSIESPLEWYSSDYPTKINWNTANAYCASLSTNLGQYPYVAWRLPTIDELASVHSTTSSSTPTLKNWFYWSSTEVSTTSTSSAYDLDMTSTIISSPTIFYKNLPDDYVRCVRSINITVPDAPTDVSATAGDSQALVSFNIPESNGGSPITYYTITSNPGNIIATTFSNSATIAGLTNGTTYTFSVTASNVAGMGTSSAASNGVIPLATISKGRPTTYIINNWTDLNDLRNNLNSTYTSFILVTDLSSTTQGYSGVGNNWNPIDSFSSTLDGQGHTISDLIINTAGDAGLFKNLSGSVSNFGLVNENITSSGISSNVGGITASLATPGTINNCYVTGNVTGTDSHAIGGLVGSQNGGTISYSYSTGNINTYGDVSDAGGLVGIQHFGTINNSYSMMNLTGNNPIGISIGGLVGGEYYSNPDPYSSASTLVSESYATGNVTVTGTGYSSAGGLVGNYDTPSSHTSLINSYAIGNVIGQNAGGLVGSRNSGIIDLTYSAGSVSGTMASGGLVGVSSGGNVYRSFWDIQTSGQPTSAGGMGTSTNVMKTIGLQGGPIYYHYGWSGSIWSIIGGSYPTLR